MYTLIKELRLELVHVYPIDGSLPRKYNEKLREMDAIIEYIEPTLT